MLGFLNRQSKLTLTIVATILVLVIGIIDYITPPDIAFSIFYLVPLALAAWFVGKRAGIALSALSAVAWLIADVMSREFYTHPAIPYWNMLVRLCFFLIVTHVLSELRTLQDRQRELSEFMVHDLRSPLTSVLTGLLALKHFTAGKIGETESELVEMGIAGSRRILTLVNSILDVSRLEDGQMPLQPGRVEPKNIVDSSFEQVKSWAQEKEIALEAVYDAKTAAVQADRSVTERVLVNLLSNAVKFSPRKSAVIVNVSPDESGIIAFSVADQGPGIDEKWHNKVFEKYSQIEARKEGAPVGSGLGLSFCRLAVNAQGGRIWIEDTKGKGTTIMFTLPVAPPLMESPDSPIQSRH